MDQTSGEPDDSARLPEDLVYLPERDRSFTDGRCFLCGANLTSELRSEEHVFPRWLLRRFGLWNDRLTLLNGTDIAYHHLRIPCCRPCNLEHLSPLESEIADAFATGYEAVVGLDPERLFLWLSKIYYGLMFREVLLPLDRSEPSSGPILPSDIFEEYLRIHHLLLQRVRGVVEWFTFPASIRVVRTQVHPDPRACFDYGDIIDFPFLAIRAGGVGVIGVLQDWGAFDSLEITGFQTADSLVLHPLQFRELVALSVYIGSLFNRIPKIITAYSRERVQVVTAPLAGLSGKPLFDPFQPEDYARILAQFMGADLGEVLENCQVRTLLENEQGRPNEMLWE